VVDRLKKYCEEIPQRVEAGDGILLHGPSGTGKDHLAFAVLTAAIMRHGFSANWVNGADLYGDFRDRIGREHKTEELLVQSLSTPRLLQISDPLPPTGCLTDFQASMLFRIVDGRYSHCRPTIVTCNVASKDEAADRMGAQIVDRLTHGSLVLWCDWPSYRKPAES